MISKVPLLCITKRTYFAKINNFKEICTNLHTLLDIYKPQLQGSFITWIPSVKLFSLYIPFAYPKLFFCKIRLCYRLSPRHRLSCTSENNSNGTRIKKGREIFSFH